MRVRLLAAVAISAAALTAIGLAAPAEADPTDGEFLITLSNGGVPYGDASNAISWAHTVCDFMDEGMSMNRTTMAFMDAKGWSVDDAGYFVGAAANLYCPWNVPASMRCAKFSEPLTPARISMCLRSSQGR